MHILDTLISLLASGLAALLLLAGHLFPIVVSPPVPLPAQTVATTTANFPAATSTKTTAAKPAKSVPANGLASPARPARDVQDEEIRGPLTGRSSPAPTQTPVKTQEQINIETRAALVNILCTTKGGGYLAPISGSGVIIDTRGVILTNAHVGQFFLLRDYYQPQNVMCTVRMGSPAEPYYTAELLFLPPAWVAANANQIVATEAVGTGQNDYAFVRITGVVGSRTMPSSFPAVTLASSGPSLGEAVLLAAYPAGYLGAENIVKNLYQSSAVTFVSQLLRFADGNPTELFSIGGTVVSQAGSSGGAVVSLYNGALKGIIAVETVAASTGNRDLRAITLEHINRSLAAAGQGGLVTLLQGDIALKAVAFNRDTAPGETKQLETALDKGN